MQCFKNLVRVEDVVSKIIPDGILGYEFGQCDVAHDTHILHELDGVRFDAFDELLFASDPDVRLQHAEYRYAHDDDVHERQRHVCSCNGLHNDRISK